MDKVVNIEEIAMNEQYVMQEVQKNYKNHKNLH